MSMHLTLLPTAEPLACSAAAFGAPIAIVAREIAVTAAPPAPPIDAEVVSSAGEVRFTHQFVVRLPHHAGPVKACADLRVHLGVPEVDRVRIFPAGTMFVTLAPRSDALRRALREIRGPEAGAIRKRAFDLLTPDAARVTL